MKKAKTIGRKVLSVFLAVLMILTTWVWIAPTEASAVNSGQYSYKVYVDISDDAEISSSNWVLYGKATNGSSTESQINTADNVLNGATGEKTIMEGSTDKFPSKFTLYLYMAIGVGERTFDGTVYLQINKNGTMTSIPLTVSYVEHNEYGTHSVNGQKIHSDTDGTNWVGGDGRAEATFTFTVNSSNYPVPTKVVWDASPSAFTIPGSTYGRTHCQDQYGVTLGINPNNSFTSTPATGLTGTTSNTASYSQYTITAGDDAKMTGEGNNSRDVKMVASYTLNGTTLESSKTVKVNDPEYKFTLNENGNGAGLTTTTVITKQYGDKYGVNPGATRPGYTLLGFYYGQHADSYETPIPDSEKLTSDTVVTENHTWYAAWQANQYSMKFTYRNENGEWVTTDEIKEYFGREIPFPEVQKTINGVDYTYSFTGWSPENTTVQAVDGVTEYIAQYDTVIHYAELENLQKAIAEAKAKQDTALYKENAYTDSTVTIFEETLGLAEMTVERKPLLSEQSYVDTLADTLFRATENLDIKNYTVVFVDDNGTILKDGYYFVPHGATVEVPSQPEKPFDETNHYAFDCWDYEESNRLEECNYVTDNLIYVAVFTKESHSYTETVTPSTCTEAGVITRTCECGYSYTVAGDAASHTWSTDYKEIIPATCNTVGSEALYCTECGAIDESTKRDIAKLGHAWGKYTEYTPATCVGEGSKVAECSRCGGKDVEKIPQKSHSYGSAEVIKKTCTTDGYTKETCTVCGFINITNIDVTKGHALKGETLAETCVSVGYAKTICANCDFEKTTFYPATGRHTYPNTWEKLSDASCVGYGVEKRVCTVCNGATETRLIPMVGHTLPDEWKVEVSSSCGSEGRQVKDCTVCGKELESETIAKLSHNYVVKTVVDPTCTSKGYTIEKCDRDDCESERITNETAALNHAWTSTRHEADCTHSAYIEHVCGNDATHNYIEYVNDSTALLHDFDETIEENVTIVKAATCEADGEKTVKCSRCDGTTTVVIPKLGHNYGEWDKTTNPATNDKDGTWTRICENCNDVETLTIPKGGHNFVEDTSKYVAPKCNSKGQRVYMCSAHENCIATVTVELDYAQHKISQRETPATCGKTGTVEAYCTACNTVFSSEEIPVIPHTLNEGTAVAPTCTTSGYTLYECIAEGCDFNYKEYNAEQSATGHTSWTETGRTNETCTTDGSVTYKCDKCNATKTETLPKKAHNYVKQGNTVAATCETPSTETYKCENCDDTYVEFISGTVDHKWGDWKEIQKATTSSYGIDKRECSVCKTVEHRTTAPTGAHVFEKISETPASCTSEGSIEWKCKTHENCEANYTETLSELLHTAKIAYVAPTCIATGSTQIICSVCSAELTEKSTIPVVAHNYDVTGVETPATCETTGTMTYTCATDGCTATKTETIPKKGHDLKTKVTLPECGKKGSVVTTCSRCNYSETTELAAINHAWDEGEATTSATCTTAGTMTYTCTICKSTKTETIKALGHDWGEWTVVPSTNNDKGSVSRLCKRAGCTEKEIVDIPAGGHNLVVDKNKSTDATCTAEGSIIYTCEKHDNCGITVTVTIPAKGHTNVVVTTQATCEKDGSIVEKCGICENVIHKTTVIPKKGHAWDNGVVTKNATCTDDGVKTYTCANDAKHTYEETIPATGHKITAVTTQATCIQEGSVVEECSKCGYKETVATIPMLQHDFSGVVIDTKDAKCTEDGSKTIQCKTEGCTATTTVVVPHTGHTWNAWTITKPATNTADGEMTRTCSNNKCTETVVIPAGGHTWDNGTVKDEATCTKTGTMVYKCNNTAHLNCTASYEVTIPVKQHTIVTDNKEATCTETGHSKTICSYCNVEFNSVVIPVKAHVYEAGTAVAPTCTTSGYTPYTCTCGASYNEYDAEKKATGHNLVEGISTATCVGAGEMTLSCNNSGCNYSRTVNVPELGHNYVEDVDAATTATCAAAATKTYKCSRCTDSYTISVGEKSAEHTWDETKWQVQVSATPSSLGYKTNACTVCGQIKVETIPATGEHNFNKENSRQDATCTADGWIKYECSTHTNCGLTSTVTIPATGHTEAHEYKAATCTKAGYSRMVCTAENNAVLAETVIPALGHLCGEGTVTNATCNTEGKIEYECTRENCNSTHETVIEKNSNAHQYVTVVKDSTCTVPGKVVTKCNLCKVEIEVKTLPLIEHTWNNGEIKEGDKATCTADGTNTFTCTCGATKTEVIAKLGHDWGAWTETKASTNTEKGTLTRTCSRGCKETAEIPAGGHNLVVDKENSKASTCTEAGHTTYICDVKHAGDIKCDITVTVTLDKLQHELVTTKTDATCEKEGSVVTKCNNCNTATITTTIPATGHTYNDGVKTAATCTATGKIVYTCTADKCGKTKEVILDKLQHNYQPGTPVDATCTSSGYTPYKCSGCASEYVIITSEAKTHDFKKDSSDATCTVGGKMILKCACGMTMETEVPALGHNYELKSTTTATCKDDATETYKCSRCDSGYTVSVGAKTDAHNMAWETVDATNTSLGYKIGTCSDCGKVTVEIIPATGEHVFDVETNDKKAATCTEDGYIVYSCSVHTGEKACGLTSEVKLPANGHKEKLSYKAATCTEEGYTKIVCSVEGCDYVAENTTIPALDHVWGKEEITQSTCSSTGSVVFTCTSCNNATKTVTIPENDDAHSLKIDSKLATCKEAGYVKVICTNEGCEYSVETELPILHHDWSNWTKTDSTNGTAGSWVSECSICKDKKSLEIPKGGHKFGDIPDTTTPASCTAPGTATYNCIAHTGENACGVAITVTLAKTQHEYVTNTEPASCSKEGSITVSCSVCGNKLVDNMATAKLPHTYEEIKTDATCTQAGYTTFKCKVCNHSYDRFDSNPLPHSYTTKVTAPTCTTAGYTTHTCQCGFSFKDNFVEAKSHTYAGVVKAPSCTEAGYTTFTCACGESYVGNPVSPNGHVWGSWEVVSGADGDIIRRTCQTNSEHTEEYSIPAGGHEFNTDSPSDITTGNCKEEGTKTFKCTKHTDCGVEITVKTELGAHAWTQWTKQDATNTADGSWSRECTLCDTKESHVIPAGNHSFKETPDSVEAATCSKTGTATYKCTNHENCGVVITVKLDKIQHTPKVEKVNSSCKEAGYVKTYCEKCNEPISYVTLEILPHIPATTEVTEKSTCITEGTEVVKCSCGEVISENKLPLADHKFDVNGDGKIDLDDASWIDGEFKYVCQIEGCTHTERAEDEDDNDDEFTVRFFDADKKVMETVTVEKGKSATASKTPEKAADENYHYTFSGWDRTLEEITSDLDVYPTYEKEAHSGGKATCKEYALCEKCGREYGELDETMHNIVVGSTIPATCETDGEITYVCANGCTYEKKENVGKLQHNYGEWEVAVKGICDKPTVYVRKCTNYKCEAVQEYITYGTHTWYSEPAIKATCTSEGYTEFKLCTVCGLQLDREKIAKLEHNDTDGDGRCDYCNVGSQESVFECGCMCHETGFMKFIYTIVRFFWKLTKSSPSCSCGAVHY